MVSMLQERAPNIGDDLLSSRVCLKFFMSECCAGQGLQGKRWSLFKPVAEALKNLCLSGWETKEEISGVAGRFAPPEKPENIPGLAEMNREYMKITGRASVSVASKWAVCVNMTLNQQIASSSVNECIATIICFGEKQLSGRGNIYTPYLVAEKVRTTMHLLRCDFQSHQGCGGGISRSFKVKVPLQFTTSHDVLSSFFQDVVKRGKHVSVMGLGVNHFATLEEVMEGSGILQGTIGPTKLLLKLTKPDSKLLRQLGQQTTDPTQGPTDRQDHGQGDVLMHFGNAADAEQASDSKDVGNEQNDSNDAAAEGLNLLLEEAENEQQRVDHDDINDSGNGSDQQDQSPDCDDVTLADNFCRQEITFGSGCDQAQDDAEERSYAEEFGKETGETEVTEQENKIVDQIKQASSYVSATNTELANPMGDHLTFEETINEALLNDARACGNFANLLVDNSQNDVGTVGTAGH